MMMESSDGFQTRIVPQTTGLFFRSVRPRPSRRGAALAVSPELWNFGFLWFLRQCQNQNIATVVMGPIRGANLLPTCSKICGI